jgi:hypothetical protein
MDTGIGIAFLVFGLSALAAGFLLIRNVYRKLRIWTTVSGTLISYEEYPFGKQWSYAPQVQFPAPDGRLITFTSQTASSRRP